MRWAIDEIFKRVTTCFLLVVMAILSLIYPDEVMESIAENFGKKK